MATQFIARSKKGLELLDFNSGKDSSPLCTELMEKVPKQCRFSATGLRLAVALPEAILVYAWAEGETAKKEAIELGKIPISQCVDFVLSPSGRYIATYEKPVPSMFCP